MGADERSRADVRVLEKNRTTARCTSRPCFFSSFPGSLELAENVSRALPEDPTALLLAARALRRLGRIPEAVERIKRARALEPDDGRLPAFHACLALDEADVEKARALVAQAERLAPGDVWPALARAELAVRTEPPDRVRLALAAAQASVNAHPIALLGDEITSLTFRAS
jgi:predicted Zn-dependent protease